MTFDLVIWQAGLPWSHLRQVQRSRAHAKVQGHMRRTWAQQLLRRLTMAE